MSREKTVTVKITFDPDKGQPGVVHDPMIDLDLILEFGAEYYCVTDWHVIEEQPKVS